MKVSIITSTYQEFNTGQLQRAIASLRAQTHKDWELIIVGDATPYEGEIKNLLANLNDKRITFLNLHTRAGIFSPGTVPKKGGVELSSGELIAFLDADNTYFPNHLERCVMAFQNDPALDLAYGDTKIIFNFQFSIFKHLLSFTWKKPDWTQKRLKLLHSSNFLDMSEPVFTKKAYYAAGGLTETTRASDWQLWRAMLTAGHSHFKHLNHTGITYYTASLQHHISYFLLMIAQNLALPYESHSLSFFVDRFLRAHHKRKHR